MYKWVSPPLPPTPLNKKLSHSLLSTSYCTVSLVLVLTAIWDYPLLFRVAFLIWCLEWTPMDSLFSCRFALLHAITCKVMLSLSKFIQFIKKKKMICSSPKANFEENLMNLGPHAGSCQTDLVAHNPLWYQRIWMRGNKMSLIGDEGVKHLDNDISFSINNCFLLDSVSDTAILTISYWSLAKFWLN